MIRTARLGQQSDKHGSSFHNYSGVQINRFAQTYKDPKYFSWLVKRVDSLNA
jgi:hypothetical protein